MFTSAIIFIFSMDIIILIHNLQVLNRCCLEMPYRNKKKGLFVVALIKLIGKNIKKL